MTTLEKYTNAFVECFNITPDEAKTLQYQSIKSWDSVGHMSLVTLIEDAFDIMLDTDDIIDFSSFEKGLEILQKYEVK